MKRIINSCQIVILVCIIGCTQTGRYHQAKDTPPKVIPNHIPSNNAEPKYEPYAPANMRPYTVRGVHYTPMQSAKGYSAIGQASWYGQKFHGHLTANGEIYDMFKMSAAHKTLPLPSFVRVTNLKNGSHVIVRVNDRGPFHQSRLIDLSYAAALKLDMLKSGVSEVKIDVIHVSKDGEVSIGNQQALMPAPQHSQPIFIQVLALKNKSQIQEIGLALTSLYQQPYTSVSQQGMYKLRLGPLYDEVEASQLLTILKNNGYPNAYKVYKE